MLKLPVTNFYPPSPPHCWVVHLSLSGTLKTKTKKVYPIPTNHQKEPKMLTILAPNFLLINFSHDHPQVWWCAPFRHAHKKATNFNSFSLSDSSSRQPNLLVKLDKTRFLLQLVSGLAALFSKKHILTCFLQQLAPRLRRSRHSEAAPKKLRSRCAGRYAYVPLLLLLLASHSAGTQQFKKRTLS